MLFDDLPEGWNEHNVPQVVQAFIYIIALHRAEPYDSWDCYDAISLEKNLVVCIGAFTVGLRVA